MTYRVKSITLVPLILRKNNIMHYFKCQKHQKGVSSRPKELTGESDALLCQE